MRLCNTSTNWRNKLWGLDITAYTGIVRIGDRQGDEPDGCVSLYTNPAFPGREEGAPDGLYRYEVRRYMLGIGYGRYYAWREELARMAGYKAEDYWLGYLTDLSKPFAELIMFSDCEGTIGPVVAARLVAHFDEYEKQAIDCYGEQFFRYYRVIQHGLRIAALRGALKFA